jgi:3-oxoadipate enol-lactonase/4-carboxymuconolactone decarboxylase
MPLIHANGLRQYYRLDGNDKRPVLVLSQSLGCDHSMWDAQAAALAPHFLVLRYDTRGHGASDATPGSYSIEMLAADALGLLDALGIERFIWCGLSLGGMIGQRIAADAPGRLTNLILANTSPRLDQSAMESRRRTVLEQGMKAIVETVMGRFFMASSLAANSPAVAGTRRTLLSTNPVGYAGCCAAIRDMDHVGLLGSIRCPTLIISGNHDPSTPWAGHGEVLASKIANARVEHLPTAHLSNLERPGSFTAALHRFLTVQPEDTLAAGFERRRAILGNGHVDHAVASTTDLTRAFQEFITRFAWGTVWQRPGFDDRTRRLLVLAITASLSRWDEFRMHLSAGLKHELEPCDVEELLLQVAVYAGVPAANTGFHFAKAELGPVNEASGAAGQSIG